MEGEGVGAHSLAHSTLGVKGRVGALDGTKKINTDLHKLNNKLVNV